MITKTLKLLMKQCTAGGLILMTVCSAGHAGPEHTTANRADEGYVKIISPINGFQTNESAVAVTIEYQNILALTLNGNPITINAGAHTVTVTVFLVEGQNTLTAVGKTYWGQLSDSINVILDTHPPVLDYHPTLEERKATSGSDYTFDARLNEQDFTPNEYQFRINGEVKQIFSNSSVFHYIPEPTESGNKTLTVEARDIGGEASQDIGIYVYRNPS